LATMDKAWIGPLCDNSSANIVLTSRWRPTNVGIVSKTGLTIRTLKCVSEFTGLLVLVVEMELVSENYSIGGNAANIYRCRTLNRSISHKYLHVMSMWFIQNGKMCDWW
jgi:hypothetical protein